jgi:hypothetical protein
MSTQPQSEAERFAEVWARLTPEQRQAVEDEHEDRMAARLAEVLTDGDEFTMDVPSRAPAGRRTAGPPLDRHHPDGERTAEVQGTSS